MLSMVHPGRPCLHCTLCKEKYPVYTHPIKWKNEHLYTLLRELEPNISIQPESCMCRNCRDDLLDIQHAGPTSKGARPPRWALQDSACIYVHAVSWGLHELSLATTYGSNLYICTNKCSQLQQDQLQQNQIHSWVRTLGRSSLKYH